MFNRLPLPRQLVKAIALFTIAYSPISIASDWHIMLIPDDIMTENSLNFTHIQNNIESGLSVSLSRGQEILIDKQKVFKQCQQKWCSESSIDALFAKISTEAPTVQLVLLYSLISGNGEINHDYHLQIKLVDPLTFQHRVTEQLSLLDSISPKSLRILGQDAGVLIINRLRTLNPQKNFTIRISGFAPEEISSLDSFILANTNNVDFSLQTSKQTYAALNHFLPVYDNQYQVLTTLDANQIKQMLVRYFQEDQALSTKFLLANNGNTDFHLSRSGSPYLLLIVNVSIVLLLVLLATFSLIRRHYLIKTLQKLDQQRNADTWLITYDSAQFPVYFLRTKFAVKANYWSHVQSQSSSLAKQAKVYFEAGDSHTAKLFVTKSLALNACNKKSIQLAREIDSKAHSKGLLTVKEGQICAKIEKAMCHYRQQKPLQALRCLYQALAMTRKLKPLKKQAKAIKKLIKKFNQEFSISLRSISLSKQDIGQRIDICHSSIVHLGRKPNVSKHVMAQDTCHFYVNHKAISKVGQQASIEYHDHGYTIFDQNSKNGTYVNQGSCLENTINHLSDGDLLQLGGTSPITSVAMTITQSSNRQLLHLKYDVTTPSILNKSELDKVWPDHAQAFQTELVCTQQGFIIAFEIATQRIKVCTLDTQFLRCDKGKPQQEKAAIVDRDVQAICMITLGKNACIKPISTSEQVLIESVPLLGEMPLVPPCKLVYKNISFDISMQNCADEMNAAVSHFHPTIVKLTDIREKTKSEDCKKQHINPHKITLKKSHNEC